MFIYEKIKKNPKFISSIIVIFFIYFIIYSLFNVRILPSFSFDIGNVSLPPFQTTQMLFVFPLMLCISYILFIRRGVIKWQDLGFNFGNNGLIYTISLGFLGGLTIGVYNFFLMDYFLLKNQVMANFIEKCLFAPVWEEFFNRALLLIIFEVAVIVLLNKYYFENPKYKEKISENSRRKDLLAFYLLILLISGLLFVWWHNILMSSNILIGGMIIGAVYLKTRSLISPIIVHSMSNFVTGGFLFLILHNLGF